jgi:hypothetical protein
MRLAVLEAFKDVLNLVEALIFFIILLLLQEAAQEEPHGVSDFLLDEYWVVIEWDVALATDLIGNLPISGFDQIFDKGDLNFLLFFNLIL